VVSPTTDRLAAARAALGLPKDASASAVLAQIDQVVAKRRDRLVRAAIDDGRIPEGGYAKWRAELDRGGVKAEKVLASLTPALAPPGAAPASGLSPELRHAFGLDRKDKR
jgi:hypothetical protein